MRQAFIVILYHFILFSVTAEIMFSDLAIDENDMILFSVETDPPNFRSHKTAFTAEIDSSVQEATITQLTFFPEYIDFLPSLGQLQILNRFGLFRSNIEFENIIPVSTFPNFAGGTPVSTGTIDPVSISPDGRYIAYFEETSAAFGNLMLSNFVDDNTILISSDVELNITEFPVSWSPDSNIFIYHKNGSLYYFSTSQFEEGRLFAEELRRIGQGQISNIHWGRDNELFYLTGTVIYQILSVEFLVQTIYQDFLQIGTVIGTIPFPFDPNFDDFWISPNKNRILLNKGGRNLYLYPIQTNDFNILSSPIELPYLYLPINSTVKNVLWSFSDILTVQVEEVREGDRISTLYRLNFSEEDRVFSFERLEAPLLREIFLSDDERSAVVLAENFAIIYSYQSWRPVDRIRHNNLLHFVFVNENEAILAGEEYIERYDLISKERRIIALSRSDALGFSATIEEILIQTDRYIRGYNIENGRIFERNDYRVLTQITSNENYRVYADDLTSGSYSNIIRLRQNNSNFSGQRTVNLVSPPQMNFDPFPETDEPLRGDIITHGSRIRRREVSFVFNAINSVLGLNNILNVLDNYNIRATFFINGEFMRQFPGAVQEITQFNHEIGSLYSRYYDFSSSPIPISSEAIQEGIIENEDRYFEITSDEMELIWHAPYYYVSPEIIEATKSLNYRYIGRDVDSLDWISSISRANASDLYLSSAQIIERIIENKQPGSIISMTVGTISNDDFFGGRGDYLFHKLDILINNLIEQGYSIVPVTQLIDSDR